MAQVEARLVDMTDAHRTAVSQPCCILRSLLKPPVEPKGPLLKPTEIAIESYQVAFTAERDAALKAERAVSFPV